MIDLFESHTDLYVYCGKIAFPEGEWSDKRYKKAKRGIFKQILLGKMYGMGENTLAANAGITLEEAQRLTDILFSQFKTLKKYISEMMEYPLYHDGYLRTLLGDALKSSAWRFMYRPDGKIDTNARARVMRHGINYCVQGASACILARGFYNNFRAAKRDGFVLEPIIVVHDSSTNYFPAEKVFEINDFYSKNFTEFCRHQCGVPFLFDLFVGCDYEDAAQLSNINQDSIKLSGSAQTINKVLNRLDDSKVKYIIDSVSVNGTDCGTDRSKIISDFIENPIERFISAGGCCIEKDRTSAEVQITRII